MNRHSDSSLGVDENCPQLIHLGSAKVQLYTRLVEWHTLRQQTNTSQGQSTNVLMKLSA